MDCHSSAKALAAWNVLFSENALARFTSSPASWSTFCPGTGGLSLRDSIAISRSSQLNLSERLLDSKHAADKWSLIPGREPRIFPLTARVLLLIVATRIKKIRQTKNPEDLGDYLQVAGRPPKSTPSLAYAFSAIT